MGGYQSIETEVPDLSGKVIVITGGNSGIGFEAAKIFAQKNATVILGCRSKERGEKAVSEIKELYPDSNVEYLPLELGNLDSISRFVNCFGEKYEKLDILCNNAGLMAIAKREETDDGFEMQWGVNVFGHFALTLGLLDKMERADDGARIVNVSSGAAFMSFGIDFDNLDAKTSYNKWSRYAETKLGNLLFTHALNRRFKEKNMDIEAVSCHPGYSATNLQHGTIFSGINALAQSAEMGCLPTIMAALDQNLSGGEFVGPAGIGWGYPIVHPGPRFANDQNAQDILWKKCEEATNLSF